MTHKQQSSVIIVNTIQSISAHWIDKMTHEKWKRPSGDLKFPMVFSKFTRDGEEYRIEDIPEDRYVEACEFMLKYFVPYEPKLVSRNGKDDPLVLEDCFNLFMRDIRQKVSVACLKGSSNDFIGINILEVLGRNDVPSNIMVTMMLNSHLARWKWIDCRESLSITDKIEDMRWQCWGCWLCPRAGWFI